jgi:hypothetical protein
VSKQLNKMICPRCAILFEMKRNSEGSWSIVLPPHDPRCPVVAPYRPASLPTSGGKDR